MKQGDPNEKREFGIHPVGKGDSGNEEQTRSKRSEDINVDDLDPEENIREGAGIDMDFDGGFEKSGEELVISVDDDTVKTDVLSPGGGYVNVREASQDEKDSIKNNEIPIRKTLLEKWRGH